VTDLLDLLLDVARQAASVILEVYARPFHVDYKSPRDPVTDADRRANELICERLSREFPRVPVVAEESDPSAFEAYRTSDRAFFVDPLDGTREFVQRNGEFVVMIGLAEGGRPTAGLLHAPVGGKTWMGGVGAGATVVEADGTRRALRVSATDDVGRARVVATRSHRSPALEAALRALGAERVDALGSAGLKCAEVAQGAADAYVAPARAGSLWDVCAGEAVVRAAGGRFTDAHGSDIDYRSESLVNERGIVASNGLLHELLLARLAGARARG
jgi:3'(2'), 5'-bisphosphate nucleotidase